MTEADRLILLQLAAAPYIEGGSSITTGVDCWGVIEVSYALCPSLQIALPNRQFINPGPRGLYRGWKGQNNFIQVFEPQEFDVILMSSDSLPVGHCGLYFESKVMHAENEEMGVVVESTKLPQIENRITGILRHVSNY